jgi:hypothetical protein
MIMSSQVVTIPKVTLTLEELLQVIRQLDEAARIQVAQALTETQMDARLTRLIEELAQTPAIDDVSDAEIQAEINAVRRAPSE